MKKSLTPLIIVVVVLALIGSGGWYYLSTLKSSLKETYSKQIVSFTNLRTKVDQVTMLYQESSETKTDNKTNVLGATTSKDPKAAIVGQVESVLGIEDSKEMKRSRDIVELLSQSLEEVQKISTNNTSVANSPGLPLLRSGFGVKAPTDSTAKLVADVNPILETIKKEEDIAIRSYSVGFDLGATLQLALMRADEESVKKLETKIADLEKLADEEKALLKTTMPSDLKQIIEKSNASSSKLIANFKDLPDIIRKKDVVALQNKVATLLVDAGGDGVKLTTELISFLRNNSTLRSIDAVKDEWSEGSKTL